MAYPLSLLCYSSLRLPQPTSHPHSTPTPPMLHAANDPGKSVSCCVMPCPHLLPQPQQAALLTAWLIGAWGSLEHVAHYLGHAISTYGVLPPNSPFLDANSVEIRETESGDNFSYFTFPDSARACGHNFSCPIHRLPTLCPAACPLASGKHLPQALVPRVSSLHLCPSQHPS